VPTTDPKPAPTTFADLIALPGWRATYSESIPASADAEDAVEPDTSTANIVGAVWAAHGHTVQVRDRRAAGVVCVDMTPFVMGFNPTWEVGPDGVEWAVDNAIFWATRIVRLIESVAAAAPPPPPTTIADLATRPGWFLLDGEACHTGGEVLAGKHRVEVRGDKIGWFDEQECAELAFSVAEITARAQARYEAANPDQE
jgi:hypothetical protein